MVLPYRYIKGLVVLAKDSFLETNLRSKDRFFLKKAAETYLDMIEAYDDEMRYLSEKIDFAPGRLGYHYESYSFYYRGAEVIYIFPWERTAKETSPFFDTKYGYLFDDFYEYAKLRYAKEDFPKRGK